MDASLSLKLQQAWLLTQINKQHAAAATAAAAAAAAPPPSSSPWPVPSDDPPWSSHGASPSTTASTPDGYSPPSPSWPALQAELAALSESWEWPVALPSNGSGGGRGLISPVSASSTALVGSWPSFSGSDQGAGPQDAVASAAMADPAAAAAASFEDDAMLMDPVLEFISGMLMDEQMEDRKCMRQECTAYQAIANGFYEILGEDSSPHSSCTELQVHPPCEGEPGEDYSWIDDVLVSDPAVEREGKEEEQEQDHFRLSRLRPSPSPWLFESSSSSGSERDLKPWPWPLDSTSSSSIEQDARLCTVDSSSLQGSPSVTESMNSTISSSPAAIPLNKWEPAALLLNGIPTLLNDVTLSRGENGANHLNGPQQALPIRVGSEELLSAQNSLYLQHMSGNGSHTEGLFRKAVSDQLFDRKNQFHEGDVQKILASDIPNGNGPIASLHDPHLTWEPDQKAGRPPAEQPLSFVNNADLNAEMHAKIYTDWSCEEDGACLEKKKKVWSQNNGTSNSGGGGARKRAGSKPDVVDLRGMLVSCAQAVAANDLRKANEILQDLRPHTSPYGSAAQRLAHYFAEGLVARLSGTGARLYTAMSNNRPSAAKMLKAFRLMVEVCPYAKLSHYFANQSILKVAEGASRLHIVDYGILYGIQWPCLISALAERKGGPPFLRITGIEFPQPGLNPAEGVEETGRRLAEYAKTYNVPFEYNAIASKWEDVDASSLNLKQGEVLVVNCIHRLRNLMDETVVSASPRKKVLSRMRSFNPDMVLIAVMNAGFNAPFFVSRFREALYHFSSKFDMIETTVGDSENPERLMMEKEVLGRDILNVVACEGPERVERPETYRQWQARFQRAGFQLLPLNPSVLSKARKVVKHCYHKDFSVDDDSKWMLLGWKGRIVEGLSAWKPSHGAAN